MSKDKVGVPAELVAALKQFRCEGIKDITSESMPEAYFVVGYSNENTLCEVAQGPGGLAEAAAHLGDDDSRYVILRKWHRVELAKTVKFAYIDWTPETIRPMRKALLSTHKGQVEAALKPYHVSLQAISKNELNDAAIVKRIEASSGTAVNVVAHGEMKRSTSSPAKGPSLVPSAVTDSRPVHMEDEQAIRDALKEVRSDASGINWALVGYKDGGANIQTLVLLGKGSGGIPELQARFDENQVFYALFRTVETFDQTQRVIFGFMKLLSDRVPPMQRAKISTQMGFITTVFEPYHVDFHIDNKLALTEDVVRTKIQQVMGTKSAVRTAEESKHMPAKTVGYGNVPAAASPGTKFVPTAALGGKADEVTIADADNFKAAMVQLRADPNQIDWLLTGWSGKDTISVLGTGKGGVEEMLAGAEAENANFGLLRVTDKIDNSITVKFVFVRWLPDAVSYMKKAQVNTKKGAIDAIFSPFHVDLVVAKRADVSTAIVMDRVTSASGSKSNVRP